MAARDYDTDVVDDPLAIDVVQGTNENENELETSRGRKKPRKVEAWGSYVAQKKRNLGQVYVSYKTKKEVTARSVGSPCPDECFQKLTHAGVQNIFNEFWALGSYDSQNAYIQKMVEVVPVKRKRVKEEYSKRSNTRQYFVMHNNNKTKVYKQGFMAMHSIGTTHLTTALGKVTGNVTLITDQRGHHTPANQTK